MFPVRFSKYFFTATTHLINAEGCIDVIRINIKTLMITNTEIVISIGRLFVGFSSDNHCHLLQKSYLLLERVFSFSLHAEYNLVVSGQFIIIR